MNSIGWFRGSKVQGARHKVHTITVILNLFQDLRAGDPDLHKDVGRDLFPPSA